MKSKILLLSIFLTLSLISPQIPAQLRPTRPKPIAVRWWGQALVSIETYWDLTVVIDPYDPKKLGAYDDPKLSGDLVLVTHEHFDHNNVEMIQGGPQVLHGLDEKGQVAAIDKVLDRAPNADKPILNNYDPVEMLSEHAIRVRTIASDHDSSGSSERGKNAMFLIEAYGVRLLHCGDLGQGRLTDDQLNTIGGLDVLLIPVGGVYTIDADAAMTIIGQLRPRYVVPIHYGVEGLSVNLAPVDNFLKKLPQGRRQRQVNGNTLAVALQRRRDIPTPEVVVLKPRPWQMPSELAMLFAPKEQAALACLGTYTPLSVNQMNHRPSDGTHTPRWNAEHIAGRELGFFSAIYSHRDPEIPHLDLNPAQDPPDYRPAHPDWTGAEEARRIERAQHFTRRFAYLLEGIELNAKPEGAPWPLRELFQTMTEHHTYHTEQVRKKFNLPDWPKE